MRPDFLTRPNCPPTMSAVATYANRKFVRGFRPAVHGIVPSGRVVQITNQQTLPPSRQIDRQ